MGQVIHELLSYFKDEEVLAKEQEYMDYLKNHIANVQKAYKIYFLPLLKRDDLVLSSVPVEEFKQAIRDAKDNVEKHDQSKYEDIEFFGYRKHFYPTESEKSFGNDYAHESEMYYEEAWKHHYENNPHHQEYWIDPETNTPRDMELKYIVEMLSDWVAMSMYFNSDTIEWYEKEAKEEKHNMTERTKMIVEELLYNVLFK